MKRKLSILVPAIPGRAQRLKAILTRCSMSAMLYGRKYPEDKLGREGLEFVIVDGGSDDHTKDMCCAVDQGHVMKYIYVPIKRFVNAGYPRNIGLRVCEGEVIGHLDVDHYPSENIVEGMLRPFVEGKADRHINRGYVIDSSKSPQSLNKANVSWLQACNSALLNPSNLRCAIASAYGTFQIPPPGKNQTLWIWSAKSKFVRDLQGYDELYCRRDAYSREEDCWRQRMLANGMPIWDEANQLFCAIHLWHPALWRQHHANDFNKQYFKKIHGAGVIDVGFAKTVTKSVAVNQGWDWGKMLEGSFSIMDGIYREPEDHEQWIDSQGICKSYSEPAWRDMDHYWNQLETYVD